MSKVLAASIFLGLALLLMTPLLVYPGIIHPFLLPKAVYARGLMLLVVGLWLILMLWDRGYRLPRSTVILVGLLYVAVVFLSAALGVSWSHSLWSSYERMTGVGDLALWFLLATVAVSVLRTPRAWRMALNWSLAVALTLCLVALGQAFQLPLGGFLESGCRVYSTLGNPSYLASILVVSTLIAAGMLSRSFLSAAGNNAGSGEVGSTPAPLPGGPHRFAGKLLRRLDEHPAWTLRAWRVFWLTTALLGVWVLFQTGTRGALVGLVAGALAAPLAVALWGNRKAILPVALGFGGVLLAVFVLFALEQAAGIATAPGCQGASASSRLTTFVTKTAEEGTIAGSQNVALRVDFAKIGLKGFRDRPLLGWGHANYEHVFQRYAEASIYRYTGGKADLAHNQVIDELATHGALGTLLYGALWLALVWAVVRRRRPPREEVLAYAVLGGLAGYFTQNLFLFDTPGAAIFWIMLVAWVAALELRTVPAPQVPPFRKTAEESGPASPAVPAGGVARGLRNPLGGLWARRAATAAIIPLLGFSIYYMSYLPSVASQSFIHAYDDPQPLEQRLAEFQQGFNNVSALANLTREIVFSRFSEEWDQFSPQEKQRIALFVLDEMERALKVDPRNVGVVWRGVAILQRSLNRESIGLLDPYVRHLEEHAPQRVYTYLLRAQQEVIQGNYREAMRISEEWEALAPWAAGYLRDVKGAAEIGLRSEQRPVIR